jgi:ATP-dependent DNA helicase RecQ
LKKKEKRIRPIPKPKKLEKDKTYSVDKIRKKFPHAYASWKEADDKLLLKLKSKGWTIKQLAERFKRKEGAISSRLKKLEEGLIRKE